MNIQTLLAAWGKGKSIDSAPNDYPSQTPFARLIAEGDIGMAPMSPDEHDRVDRIVSAMKHRKPAHHTIIFLAYVKNHKDAKIARLIKSSSSSVRSMRQNAEHYLEAKLE